MSHSASAASVKTLYQSLSRRHTHARKVLGRDLTLAEKILWSHMDDPEQGALQRGKDFALLRPDRVALQDATAQMAILQFMQAGRDRVAVPVTVHCDHLIVARTGAAADLKNAEDANREVYEFLQSATARYGMGFWKPGSGIIHQIVLENYAFPGGLMIGTDSHTPNAGGMGMAACGVGGADAVDVMVGFPWEVLYPKIIGVRLKGAVNGWTSGKDIILKVLELLTVKGGTNAIVEYFGEGVASLSLTARATVTNMGAELGATCSIFPFDEQSAAYLDATQRADVAELARAHAAVLRPDAIVFEDAAQVFDQVIEIDLDALEPYIVGPHTPDLARPLSKLGEEAKREGWPLDLSAALIGSCTNSSYEDIGRAAHVARQGLAHGLKARTGFYVSPGSDQIQRTIARDGQAETLEQFGAKLLSNACGPCIGQWQREEMAELAVNSIVTSFNRNFKARNDGNANTHAFIASPEIVTALALAGRLDFNPRSDSLQGADGQKFRLEAPQAAKLPEKGFVRDLSGFIAAPEDGSKLPVRVSPTSDRLQILEPFTPNEQKDFHLMPVLVKAKGKCTTDHISPAGKWLKYRGHLANISDNMLSGAVNCFSGEVGVTRNPISTAHGEPIAQVAKAIKAAGKRWVIFGDENYGEGSSREHAAMSPRFLGCAAVIVRGFARIHETNLKKQGILPLSFVRAADYNRIREGDTVSIHDLQDLAPGREIQVVVQHADKTSDKLLCRHTLNQEQIAWFFAGSALNLVKGK